MAQLNELIRTLTQFATNIGLVRETNTGVLGVDIGLSSIKLVQLRNKSGVPVLETYGELALGPYAGVEVGRITSLTPEQIGTALTDLMREAGVSTERASISIPFSSSLVSMIHMPGVDQKDLASAIPIEARKYIPVPIGEVALDWFVIPDRAEDGEAPSKDASSKKHEEMQVLLVAIHNEVLGRYQRIVEAAKLRASFFEIEVFSIARALLDQTTTPTVLLDLGAATSKLYIIEHGVVRISHSINKGGQDITTALATAFGVDAGRAEQLKRTFGLAGEGDDKAVSDVVAAAMDRIFVESQRVMLNYQKKHRKNIGAVVLGGGGAAMPGIETRAAARFETETRAGNPFAKIETPAFLEETLAGVGPTFAVAIGLALRKLQEEQ